MRCLPHQSGWVRVHRQPGQMPRWGKASPGSDTSARGIDISAVVASRGLRLGKASSDTRFCNANLSGKDKAHWLVLHSVARISTEVWGDKGLHGVSSSVCSPPQINETEATFC